MKTFTYNEMEFSIDKGSSGWDLAYKKADGTSGFAGTGLFAGVSEAEVEGKAKVLAHTIFPVGLRIVGPDVAHPNLIGDLKIVGPDTVHPNFIYWDKLSSSFSATQD